MDGWSTLSETWSQGNALSLEQARPRGLELDLQLQANQQVQRSAEELSHPPVEFNPEGMCDVIRDMTQEGLEEPLWRATLMWQRETGASTEDASPRGEASQGHNRPLAAACWSAADPAVERG